MIPAFAPTISAWIFHAKLANLPAPYAPLSVAADVFTHHKLRLITGHPIDLLSDPHTAMLTVAVVDVWQWGLLFAVVIVKLLETLPRQP